MESRWCEPSSEKQIAVRRRNFEGRMERRRCDAIAVELTRPSWSYGCEAEQPITPHDDTKSESAEKGRE